MASDTMAPLVKGVTTAANPSARSLPSYARLHELMRRYQVKDLAGIDPQAFIVDLLAFCDARDGARERQHDLATRFHWGHRHDFGTFCMPGRMGNHHVAVLAAFIDALGAIDIDLSGKRVLDIGCWTGGTSLLLCAMGAQVVALEEIHMYAECAAYLGRAFGLGDRLDVRPASLYSCTTSEFQDAFDLVLFAGVLHHLSDPRLALRIAFNALRDGGRCLLETLSFDHDRRIVMRRASGDRDDVEPWGWNWLLFTPATLARTLTDVGYAVACPPTVVDGRTYAVADRDGHVDFRRSGLSVPEIR